MNIYLLTEDGETFCIKAETMAEAISIGEKQYLNSLQHQTCSEQEEKKYYHNILLESCTLIGELRN